MVQLKGVTGHSLKVSARVIVKFKIGKKHLTHEFHVVQDLSKSVILGIDFMEKQNATVDFGKRTLAIGDQIVVLRGKKAIQSEECSLVFINKKHVIEPMSVSFVEVVTKIKGTGSCVISPLDNSPVLLDQPGLVMPNIISNSSHKVRVPLVNTTSTRFSLKQKQALGIAERLSESEIYAVDPETENVSACLKTGSVDDSKVLQDIEVGHIDCKHKKKLQELMEKYRHLFAKSDNELGRTSLVEMKLNTGDHPPVKRRPYQTPFSQRPLLEKHLEGLLEAGIIRPSVSPWASPIVVVPKKDGSLRMAIDYRMTANKALIANSYPLPNIDEVLSSMQG